MDRLAAMSMFVRVVECGSFAAAAEQSQVSATMVAKHINGIERRMGARLLHRTTRRHQLTDIGRLYYERCKQALDQVALAENSALELQSCPQGVLRIVAPVNFGAEVLTPVLADYLNANPRVSVELSLDNGVPDLIAEGYHLAIHVGAIESADLVARPLRSYRRILAASPDYLDRNGRPRTPEELAGHSCLTLKYWRRRDRWRLVGPQQRQCDVQVDGRFSANQGSAVRVAALQGIGIVLQPESLLLQDLTEGRLEAVLPEWSYQPTPMYLVYARDRRPTAMLRSAIDFLTDRLRATETAS